MYRVHLSKWVNPSTARQLRKVSPPPTRLVYAIHHTIFVMAISCKGQVQTHLSTGQAGERQGGVQPFRLSQGEPMSFPLSFSLCVYGVHPFK